MFVDSSICMARFHFLYKQHCKSLSIDKQWRTSSTGTETDGTESSAAADWVGTLQIKLGQFAHYSFLWAWIKAVHQHSEDKTTKSKQECARQVIFVHGKYFCCLRICCTVSVYIFHQTWLTCKQLCWNIYFYSLFICHIYFYNSRIVVVLLLLFYCHLYYYD